MKILMRLLISTVAVLVGAYLIPAVTINTLLTGFVVAIVLGALNLFFRPILVVLTLPINILTLGLFTFIINMGLIWFVGLVVPGFEVSSLFGALLFSIVVSIVTSFLSKISN